ncbi:MAG: VOC family protein [Chitinophagaceae bacterium]
MLHKLRTVIYHVPDINAAKEWYSKACGISPYFDEPFYVGFDINGCELGLDPDMTGVTPGNQTISYWSVESVEAAAKKFTDAGAVLIQQPTNVGGDIIVAVVKDPFGNHIGLIQGA